MHQAPVPPGRECSIPQASEPAKREKVRTISPEDQEALEQAPFYEAFRELLYRAALRARARRDRVSQDVPTNEVA